ncbi:class 1 fructose-bisphosphatase [Acuticoccus sediminis]|uniref:Fructose-1,6-bisphosphatase class 1 n=1 Tax=Acuticoccus sediminis TaxID=2184697 RepID=A0A8B2NMH6_9HYPH|nr:class 1 fructose-bisphosphatase [Acuticoccus sediminis]RAI00837.1 class 1 fructose-bisphosphatase [Acuticoccus sediminis]
MNEPPTLARHLDGQREDIAKVVIAVAEVAAQLSAAISLGPLRGSMSQAVGRNTDGDRQTRLDVLADEAFAGALQDGPVLWYLSEERETVAMLNWEGSLAVAIDPLDGSSNIDANVSIGTIVSIYDALPDGDESFLRPGREQAAALYVIYGPQTAMMLTTGAGVSMFVLDRAHGEFLRAGQLYTIPAEATEFAINASNYRHWAPPIKAYIDDCLAGTDGPAGRNFNMRWIASLVAETHRILSRGGIFLYPADARPGYEEGRLRLVYECAPLAFLVEQAGGAATDGETRMLDMTPRSLHARTPFVFGSRDKVARVAAYHSLPAAEIAPLFGQRGLFKGAAS